MIYVHMASLWTLCGMPFQRQVTGAFNVGRVMGL